MPIRVRFGSSEQPQSALVEERAELFEPLFKEAAARQITRQFSARRSARAS
jgi:hypothetical protein